MYSKTLYLCSVILILIVVCHPVYTAAQTLSTNRARLLSGLSIPRSIGIGNTSTASPFGGQILYPMQGIICPGYGPVMIQPAGFFPRGPYYLPDTSLATLQQTLTQTQTNLTETRDIITHITRDGGTPNHYTLDAETAQVAQMKQLRSQIERLHTAYPGLQPSRWILGTYNRMSAPCYTDTVPPVLVTAYQIMQYGVSTGAVVVK